MSDPIGTVQAIYQAFGRGDVAAILDKLAPGVQWESWTGKNSMQESAHPLVTPRTGPQEVAGFFQALQQNLQIHDFQVRDVLSSARQAVGEVTIEYTWLPTGQRVEDEELHLWTFGDDGKVVRFRHYLDTAKHLRAAGLLRA
jgi:ketosteroid isomerase-like protein